MKNFGAIFIASALTASEALAQTPGGANPKGAAGLGGMLMPMLLVFGVFYFLMIRPQVKQQKKHKELLTQLKKGDEVVTSGGIYGRIAGIADNVVTLEIAENVRIKLDKQQVGQVKGNPST